MQMIFRRLEYRVTDEKKNKTFKDPTSPIFLGYVVSSAVWKYGIHKITT